MENFNSENEELAAAKQTFRAKLRTEFHVTTLLIPIKTVSAIIGISSSAIYSYIRNDMFFMPYRRLHNTPMIAVDDLVNWYFSVSSNDHKPAAPLIRASQTSLINITAEIDQTPFPTLESARDRIVSDTLAELAARKKKRSRA